MSFDPCTPLTLKFMGLGHPFREAERITAFIMTGVVVVLTLMGYRIRPADNECQADELVHLPSTIPGIHTGISGSGKAWVWNSPVDARRVSSALFRISDRHT